MQNTTHRVGPQHPRISQRQDPKESYHVLPMASPVHPLPLRAGTVSYQVLLGHCEMLQETEDHLYI